MSGPAWALPPARVLPSVPIALDGSLSQHKALELLTPDLDFRPDPQVVPWARLMAMAEHGDALGMAVGYSRAREAQFVFSEPIYLKRAWMFVRKTDPLRYKDFPDLQQRRLCLRRNVSYGDAFDAAADRDYQTVTVDTPIEVRLRMVASGRCDVTVLSSGERRPGNAERRLAQWPELAAEIKVLPTPMTTQTAHFVARRGSTLVQYLPTLNKALARHGEALRDLFERIGD